MKHKVSEPLFSFVQEISQGVKMSLKKPVELKHFAE